MSTQAANKIQLTPENVKYIGRTVLFEDTLFLSLSGSGIAFEYTGCGLTLSLIGGSASEIPENDGNYARIAVYVNDKRAADTQISSPAVSLRIAESTGPQTSVIRLVKLSECAMSLIGVKPLEISCGETVRPAAAKPHKIEFIGDSITCGYGVDDEDPLHPFKTATEDVTRAYAYKTAAALNADYSMFSTSGYGIISGYTGDPSVKMTNQLIPDFYESMGFSYDLISGIPAPMDIPWDYSKYCPDAVVINLGTNDDSYCQEMQERQEEYKNAYIEFLKVVRKHNPEAHIFCVLGLMGARLFPWVSKACAEYSASSNDQRITALELPEQDASIGYVSDYHPLESAHEKAAMTLVPVIRETMGW